MRNMKLVGSFVSFLLLSSHTLVAGMNSHTVRLDARKTMVSDVYQNIGETLFGEVTVVRDSGTGRNATVYVPLKYESWDCIDGYTTYNGLYGGTYECTEYAWVDHVMDKAIKLRFRKAATLYRSDKEVFRIQYRQPSYRSTKLELSIDAIETGGRSYSFKVKEDGMRKEGVFFYVR